MAKRPALIKRKSKVARTTRSEQYLVNKKHLGDEPTYVSEMMTQVELARCLSWYNYMCTNQEAREYLVEYLKNVGRLSTAKKAKSLSDSATCTTAAWIARIISRGGTVPEDSIRYLKVKLDEIEKCSEVNEAEVESPKVVISIQERMRERASEILGEVEGLIDDYLEAEGTFSFYNWLQSNEIPAAYIPKVIEKLAPRLAEILEASEGQSEDLVEAYAYCKKKDFERIAKFFNMMIEDAERYASNTKKSRQPRKPKTISVEKKIKNLKWQKEDASFKIASVLPDKIIGAQELWTFNTKYKTLTVFRAIDRGGLQVKGSSIANYDPACSFTKGTGRKPEEYIRSVLNGGKIVLRKVMEELKTDKPLAYRINENTILLRIIT